MEEFVGALWHRWVTRAATREHADAAVELAQAAKSAGLMFRALGGDPGVEVRAGQGTGHGARRRWLERLAGTGDRVELAWQDTERLCLPSRIALFGEASLNRDLFLWLAALAATGLDGDWWRGNQDAARRTLTRWPGLEARYRRLLVAYLPLRPDPAALPAPEADRERAVRAALAEPGCVDDLPAGRRAPWPVHLWLHPEPPRGERRGRKAAAEPGAPESGGRGERDQRRRRGERVDMPDGRAGFLLPFRAESLLSWAEYRQVHRPTEDDDGADGRRAADDMETISCARDATASAARLRFDLDLPSPELDDQPLGPGIRLPEWDYRRGRLQPDYCVLQPMRPRQAGESALPPRLRAAGRRLRSLFQALAPAREFRGGEPEGAEPDVDACVRFAVERAQGRACGDRGLYRAAVERRRDLACLLLADLSLSTDAWVHGQSRVIDVMRDALLLFSEALAGTGDRFAVAGFSSLKRHHVRWLEIKGFAEPYGGPVRGRIAALKPGYYTRMGTALRHAARALAQQPASERLLLLLTDGKPNDLDHYEGRYGIEDTRMAVLEARRQGLRPFCVTIDRDAGEYLPHLFGQGGFVVIRRPEELPRQLPLLYARLTR